MLPSFFKKSSQIANRMKDDYVASEHLLMALIEDKGTAGKLLHDTGLSKRLLEESISLLRKGRQVNSISGKYLQ